MAYPYADNNGVHVGHNSNERQELSSKTLNLTKVFGYMAIAILLTAILSIGSSFLIQAVGGITKENDYTLLINNINGFVGLIIGAVIALIGTTVCSIVCGALTVTRSHKAKSHAVFVPFAIYVLCIGYLFGFIVLAVPWQALAVSFGISALVYGLLALIGLISKGNLNPLLWVSMGLMSGILLLVLTNFILLLLVPALITPLWWVVSIAIFIVLILTTIWDVWNIKNIASYGEMTPNLSAFCAFRLYCDFIAIFLRILYFVLLIFGRSKR